MRLVLGFCLLLLSAPFVSATMLVEKQRFQLKNFQTFGGKVIAEVNVGWESYGTLNASKSNAILITHYFTGSSHAAGKYSPSDAKSGYWDAIIGPGKAIDTNQFFVLSVDTLANVAPNDPNVITTGPASIDPKTGKPYGLTFPVVTIRDFVNVQKAVLDSLGIDKLHAVIGPSMGSFQALDWAAAYPNKVARMVSVIGAGQSDAWTTAALQHWGMPIMSDPAWLDGDYYGTAGPTEGLIQSLMLITQQALQPEFINQANKGFANLEPEPLTDIRKVHSVVKWLRKAAAARAQTMDANHVLYLMRASQLFVAGHQGDLQAGLKQVQAKTLFLPSKGDLLLMPYLAQHAHSRLHSMGKDSQYAELAGGKGHLDGILAISSQAERLRAFLQQ